MVGAYAEVIGDPIGHSKSPLIHKHWLGRSAIEADYLATRVEPGDLASYFRNRLSDANWLGCNVTIPHKQAAFRAANRCSTQAHVTGAVNCIVPRGGQLVGYNSDVEGIAAALDGVALEGRRVAVIGGGGAARAALSYLGKCQVREITILVRNRKTTADLVSIVPGGMVKIADFGEAADQLRGAAAIINATPLGMQGCPPMPQKLLAAVAENGHAALFDMVYEPVLTSFLAAGRAERINGLPMLVGQARRSFELFFGEPPPAEDDELFDLLTGSGTAAMNPL